MAQTVELCVLLCRKQESTPGDCFYLCVKILPKQICTLPNNNGFLLNEHATVNSGFQCLSLSCSHTYFLYLLYFRNRFHYELKAAGVSVTALTAADVSLPLSFLSHLDHHTYSSFSSESF